MNTTVILFSVIALCGLAIAFAVIIFFVEQKFKVIEDPKIDEIQALLPGANCGGCGFAGCRNFAEALVKAGSFDNLNCPVGGNAIIKDISAILGIVAVEKAPEIAVVRCQGSKQHAPVKVNFEGADSCYFANLLYAGESGCPYGCLGLGDCVVSCKFDAIYIDKTTGLPVVSEENCVACGACVKACPRSIIELRLKGKKNRRIYVGCINKEKGAVAKKNCEVACIGCGKCVKVCKFDAITMTNNIAYINFEKCTLCRKCAAECPTNAIVEINFPERKPKPESEETTTVEI
ncbi:MAG: RnfABCDGE type electron transport complex subunit B [Bacteroidales bacterium]|nr:RnfABCDGE type electron transport complex subunit B [Bacteroidales bacterium]